LVSNVVINIDQLNQVSINTLTAEQGLIYDGTSWVNDYSVRNFAKIINKTPNPLSRGSVVYIYDGHNSNVANVALARADVPDRMPAIGVVYDTVDANGGEGVAVTYGKVQNVNTDGIAEGSTVYVSPTTAGGFVGSKPTTSGDLIQNIGVVVKSDAVHGVIFVTGIGRTNDIPNGEIVTTRGDIVNVYGETSTERFAKIQKQLNFRQLGFLVTHS
jgi:hypothetical protein